MKNIIFIISAVLVIGVSYARAELFCSDKQSEVSGNSDKEIYCSSCADKGSDRCKKIDGMMAGALSYFGVSPCLPGNKLDVVLPDGTCYGKDVAPDVSGSKEVCNRVGTRQWFSCKKQRNYGTPIGGDEYGECNEMAKHEVGPLRGQAPCDGGDDY